MPYTDPDKAKEWRKNHYATHREEIKKKVKKYRDENIEKVRACIKASKKKKREARREERKKQQEEKLNKRMAIKEAKELRRMICHLQSMEEKKYQQKKYIKEQVDRLTDVYIRKKLKLQGIREVPFWLIDLKRAEILFKRHEEREENREPGN